MRWKTNQYKPETYPTEWRKWFAWYPVSTDVDSFAWLETVERRKILAPNPYGPSEAEWVYK